MTDAPTIADKAAAACTEAAKAFAAGQHDLARHWLLKALYASDQLRKKPLLQSRRPSAMPTQLPRKVRS